MTANTGYEVARFGRSAGRVTLFVAALGGGEFSEVEIHAARAREMCDSLTDLHDALERLLV